MLYPGNPIRSLIIECLAENAYSTAKDLGAVIVKYLGKDLSYQAVYKNLSALIKEGTLVKHNMYYTFSLSFLTRVQKFSSTLIKNVTRLDKINSFVQNLEKSSVTIQKNTYFWDTEEERVHGIHHYGRLHYFVQTWPPANQKTYEISGLAEPE